MKWQTWSTPSCLFWHVVRAHFLCGMLLFPILLFCNSSLACNHPSWRIQINHAGGVGSIASDPVVVMDCWRIQKHGACGLVQKHQILLSWFAKNTPSSYKQRTMKLCYKFVRWHAFVELMMRTRVQQRRLFQLFFSKPLELQNAQKCLQSVENVWGEQCRYSLSKHMQQQPHLLG